MLVMSMVVLAMEMMTNLAISRAISND